MSTGGIDRRSFIGALSLLAAGSYAGILGELVSAAGGIRQRVIFDSSFEPGQQTVKLTNHKLVEGVARSGSHSVVGEVTQQSKAAFLDIPFHSSAGHTIDISFWVRSDKRSACAVFVRIGNKRISLGRRIDAVPANRWIQVKASYTVESDTRGAVQIVAPSSFGAPVGRMWIDDVKVVESVVVNYWPEHVVDFPAMAFDRAGTIWMATLERPMPGCFIGIYVVEAGKPRIVARLGQAGITGLAAPAIVGTDKGCLVSFACEMNDRWHIAYSFVDTPTEQSRDCQAIECPGNANISPALAATDDGAWVLWESNAGSARRINACRLSRSGHGPIQTISSPEANSYNPSVVALGDGRFFAAWDSLRNRSADIYGARFEAGKWGPEKRITSGRRIERHPHLAASKGQVWMAWQAQSYRQLRLNNVAEQRIAVAAITEDGLEAPIGLFDKVSKANELLVRPRIAFDPAGQLLVTARRSIAPQGGWEPLLWRYSGRSWSEPVSLMRRQGRWRGVPIATGRDQTLAACQYDDLVDGWKQRGIFPDWKSGVHVDSIAASGQSGGLDTEPLKMPATDFSLAERIADCGAELARQRWRHGGRDLTLYWGDFHDHTDISVCVRDKNPPGHDLLANVRDIEKLDFCGMTDHGYNYDLQQWALNGEQVRNNYDPGRFVTFLAQEWTSSVNPPVAGSKVRRYGHRNLIFLDPYHNRFYDSFDGDISPVKLWKQLEGVEFLCIPHQLADWKGKGGGNPPTDWTFVDEKLQPVAEIFQARKSYEYLGCPRQAPEGAPFKGYYLQDAWAKGITIGVIASPDHGGGCGKVGVWAQDLTRQAIFDAVRARHTFGTSGAKMAIRFSAGDAMMGDKVQRRGGPIELKIEAVAHRPVTEAVIFRNNEIVHRSTPKRKDFSLQWTEREPPDVERLWYYARIQAEDDELAWSSPIWLLA